MEKEVLVQNSGDVYSLMVGEKPAIWYDDMFKREPIYLKAPEDTDYYPVWNRVVGKVEFGERVADFGCGSGQFAKMLIATGKEFVLGVDFSYRAILLARDNNPLHRSKFYCGNLYDRPVYQMISFDCAVMSEVLEHLEQDLSVLNYLPAGCHVIFTVPNYYTPMHVRIFQNVSDITERYGKVIAINTIESVMMNPKEDWKIWIVDGGKRDALQG